MDGSIQSVSHHLQPPPRVRQDPTPTEKAETKRQALGLSHLATPSAPGTTQSDEGATTKAVDTANAIADFLDKKISFAYDKRINRVVVRVLRNSTDEVIRQIPPEEMIELMARLREDFGGLIVNLKG